MEIKNMKTLLVVAVFVALFAAPIVKAQTTQTNCNLYGNTADCTSTTHPSPAQDMDQFSRDMQTTAANIRAIRAARAARRASPEGQQLALIKAQTKLVKEQEKLAKQEAKHRVQAVKPVPVPTETPKAAPQPVVIPTPMAQATPTASAVDAPAQEESLGDIARRYQKSNPNAQISGQ
jgi:hypothetical protein